MFQTFAAPAPATATPPRVTALRALIAQLGLDAYLIPRADEYQNEYVPACDERLAYITGFSGSAGLAVITARNAALFVDGRYTVQAPQEVSTATFAIKGIRTTDLKPWLAQNLSPGAKIGFDPKLHTLGEIETLTEQLTEHNLTLKPVPRNLIDRIWTTDRPPAPSGPITLQPIEFTGCAATEKIAELQKMLKQAGQSAVVLTSPDSICWLFNIRGSDVAHNPIVLAYAIISVGAKPELFVSADKLTPKAKTYLAPLAKLREPAAFDTALATLKAAGKPVRLSLAASWWIFKTLGGTKLVKRRFDPCIDPKSTKTAAEISGSRAAHVRDGVAVTRFLAWFDETLGQNEAIDEIRAVTMLETFRTQTGDLKDISFPTIAGSGPNGAIVHYRVTETTNRTIQPGELFLLDSGGQYSDGTTDITRTLSTGKPTPEMCARFTLVLKGMIAISRARFPRGTRGIDIDPLARRALWDAGSNYDHGTGHGVGSYLSVHEGPQSISKAGLAELKPGMICSNEPGYYKTGHYGIRIENLVLISQPVDVGGDHPVMGFETLTLAPIDQRLIEANLLTVEERCWLNAYHHSVYEALAPHLDAKTQRWLKSATAKLA